METLESVGHQLVALRIDQQFMEMLTTQLVNAIEAVDISIASNLKIECKCLVELGYYLCSSLASGSVTPGMYSVGLKPSASSSSASNEAVRSDSSSALSPSRIDPLLLLAVVSLKYSFAKMQRLSNLESWSAFSAQHQIVTRADINVVVANGSGTTHDTGAGTVNSSIVHWKRWMGKWLQHVSKAASSLVTLNFILFLATGNYSSLLYRVIGFRMTPAGASSSSSSENRSRAGYKNSQLFVESKKMLWVTLLALTSVAATTIDWRSIRYFVFFQARNLCATLYNMRISRQIRSILSNQDTTERNHQDEVESHSQDTNYNRCAICQAKPPEMPHRIDCGHRFCYLCISQLFQQQQQQQHPLGDCLDDCW
mmetsp:Transcript_15872/g.26697  ORF Transcript_15872/g.26697 Transcript_15872/m.26697 type:complete len:368 (+) Transcript_15872:54-1157(+)